MIQGIEPLYKQIADTIMNDLPENWSIAWIDVTFYSESVQYSGKYIADKKTSEFPTRVDAERAFRRMRDLFKQANKPLWCRARFELYPDGKFKMNWSYDDCDEQGFAKFDPDQNPEIV